MTGTLNEAGGEALRLFSSGKHGALLSVLSDVYGFAGEILGFVTKNQGEGTRTEALLGRFMDMVKRAFEDIGQRIETGEGADPGFINKWRKLCLSIEKNAGDELKPDKIEVAFLPYKASMWDSMESIWLAAKDDPACDAYVVPIPYYERTEKMSFGDMVYEGGQYPAYVPVTDWKAYDIEARRPDVIIFHNPYDRANFVTVAHPLFHAERLWKHTDMLVYIPYFVSVRTPSPHFAATYGVVYADKVILQSETARNVYIKAFGDWVKTASDIKDIAKGHPLWEKVNCLEKKFVALGSPKFDKAINSRDEDFDLPEEWRALLFKDGARKPSILYNTGFTNIEAGAEAKLEKLKYALNVFKNQDKAVLWWRPHPLSEAALQSMRPQYSEEYRRIADGYREEKWGIYDGTPDLHRSLRFASLLYGDPTSLGAMAQIAEKLVIIQNAGLRGLEPDAENLKPSCLVEADGYYWFTPYYFNALMRMDKDSLEVEYMGMFPGEAQGIRQLYRAGARVGNKLYFTPYSAENMGVYDMDSGEFGRVGIPKPEDAERPKSYNADAKFTRGVEAGGKLYMLPSSYPGLLVYDVSENSFDLVDGWLGTFESRMFNRETSYFNSVVADCERGILTMFSPSANAALELDIKTNRTAVRVLGSEKSGYSGAVFAEGAYWAASLEKYALTRLGPEPGKVTEYVADLEGMEKAEGARFQEIKKRGDWLYLLPSGADRPIKFSLKSLEFSFVEGFPPERAGYVNFSSETTDALVMCPASTGRFAEYVPETGAKREKIIKMSDAKNGEEFRSHYLAEDYVPEPYKKTNRGIRENYDGRILETAIDAVAAAERPEWLCAFLKARREFIVKDLANPDGSSGEAIYKYCKNEALDR
jgi:hypothetical protein